MFNLPPRPEPAGQSPLEAAREDLRARVHAADEAGDWRERTVLEVLAVVADHTCRVGDHPDPHYRADKAGELLHAAILLNREVFSAYAGWPDEGALDDLIHRSVRVLGEAAAAVRAVLWDGTGAARDDDTTAAATVVYRSTARQVTAAAMAFSAWARTVAVGAVADPEGEGDWS